MQDPDSRGHIHQSVQRRAIVVAIGVAIVAAIVLVPLLTNPQLRLDTARSAGIVPDREGEVIADGDSGASLIVIPTWHDQESTDRHQVRFRASFIVWPEGERARLEPIDEGGAITLPFTTVELASASPDGRELYLRGADQAVLVDVDTNELLAELGADEDPGVDWDWRTPVWGSGVGRCDRVSATGEWIACFEAPVLASYLAGDWHLRIQAYGNPDERYDVARGLGFRPTLGFSSDDEWIYIQNEHGIRRFDVADVIGN